MEQPKSNDPNSSEIGPQHNNGREVKLTKYLANNINDI